MRARPITRMEQSRSRVRDLMAAVRAIRRERDQLVSELVWNEMRIGDLRAKLRGDAEGVERDEVRRELDQRLSFVESLAHWEAAADRTLRLHGRSLSEILWEQPGLSDEFPDLGELIRHPGLDDTARAAAAELLPRGE